ncbi:DNA-directed primase/polymerase protein isoform X3 [Rhodamnia argentea]|uniref:DNA-directed primase/polymerase protein n=1 Tax=Rhodamnia argentea TaxID=178133 RepID=A0A8B8PER3_9MYRT|nr:DNA-directed primase/polymerase protein isoform X3 [Rhodamnia argentea]
MDDVDRLFKCFKCGISPPESAVRERKRVKRKWQEGSSVHEGSTSSALSPGSSGQRHDEATDVQLCGEKLGSATIRAHKFSQRRRGLHISPVVFYGSPNGVPPKRPSSLLRLLNEIRVDLAAQNSSKLRSLKEIWTTFPRQEEAMKFAKAHPQVHVFSYQDHCNGQRRFLVSSYQEFWKRYNTMDPKLRHHYEVIQEGLPCHLYFDLEFNKRENADKNGDEMVDLLILVVLEVLLDKYSIQGNEEWVVELDSSTEEKFSRHLILRIPMTAFKDNSHVGAFVSEVCLRISSARETDKRYEMLFVKKDSSTSTCQIFVDTAVYSRNRCFRLALSSKAGKSSVLLPTGRYKCKDMSEEDMFVASLICNMDVDCQKLLVCKMELDCAKTLQFETEMNGDFGRYSLTSQELNFNSFPSNSSENYFPGKSPFPMLDKFIESVASIGTVSGKIRSWYWFSVHGLMVYGMSRNRFCERIGREHKSNHVIYVVDLNWAAYYQKCHDPDCKGYRSPLRPIPEDIVPDLSAFFDSVQMVNPPNVTNNVLDNDENTANCSPVDAWWLEAIRVSNAIENKQVMEDDNKENNFVDEDEDWWVDIETDIPQVELELNHFSGS